ncbi:MAG: hypothetical protein KC587_14830, partial [Nitrospira sp.]|nr:hypothetical protein [Nitrospira sp.]
HDVCVYPQRSTFGLFSDYYHWRTGALMDWRGRSHRIAPRANIAFVSPSNPIHMSPLHGDSRSGSKKEWWREPTSLLQQWLSQLTTKAPHTSTLASRFRMER